MNRRESHSYIDLDGCEFEGVGAEVTGSFWSGLGPCKRVGKAFRLTSCLVVGPEGKLLAMFLSRWLLRVSRHSSLQLATASEPPAWWLKGWPRQRVGSVAEAELLSQLAVLLMPKEPISELFRRFPSPEGWRGNYLDPDLSAYGVLKDPSAALFVEYDGYWRHGEKDGVQRDELKNATLLSNAPAGSRVIRISHTVPGRLDGSVLWIQVKPWQQGDRKSLGRVVTDVVTQTQVEMGKTLHPSLKQLWEGNAERGGKLQHRSFPLPLSERGMRFAEKSIATAGFNTPEEMAAFLQARDFSPADVEKLVARLSGRAISIQKSLQPTVRFLSDLGLSKSKTAKAVAEFPQILGCSIELNLKPTVQWLLDLGLSKSQVAKAVGQQPQILGCSIEQNLKPTAQWLLDLGLSKSQVARVVAVCPAILGYSVEQNLKPTVQWLLDLGLSKSQVAKAAGVCPQLLGLSIEQNLKPTVRWLLDLGLSKSKGARVVAVFPATLCYSVDQNLKPTVQWLLDLGLSERQVAKALAAKPQILGCSIEQNLKPTVQWLLDLGLSKCQVAKAVAAFPPILGCGIEQNLKPTVQWLLDVGLSKSQVAKAIALKPQVLGLSIEQNLKPTVQWLLDLGLSKDQVAKVIAAFPPILGLSIAKNLKPKMLLLEATSSRSGAAELLARWPPLVGYSFHRLSERLKQLQAQGKTDKLMSAMSLTEEQFMRRFG